MTDRKKDHRRGLADSPSRTYRQVARPIESENAAAAGVADAGPGGALTPAARTTIDCACGARFTNREWSRLSFVWVADVLRADGIWIADMELRDCVCQSTISGWVGDYGLASNQDELTEIAENKAVTP